MVTVGMNNDVRAMVLNNVMFVEGANAEMLTEGVCNPRPSLMVWFCDNTRLVQPVKLTASREWDQSNPSIPMPGV